MTLPPFQQFFDATRADVHRFLVASLGRHDGDDCFQDTFLAALRAYPRLRPESNLRAWVFTIANRKALDVHRRRQRHAVPTAELPDGPAVAGHDTAAVEADEPEMWRAVRALPPKQRTAVVARVVLDLPYAEVAEMAACSEEAARQNVAAGLRRLREVVRV